MPTTPSLDNLITALLGRSESARQTAVEGLVQQGSTAVAPLLDALADPHWEVRRAAVEALGRIGDPQAVIPVFLSAAESHIVHLRQAVVAALTGFPDHTVEPLLTALHDSNPLTVALAAETLGQLNDPRAVVPLWSLLTAADAVVRRAAATTLMRFSDHVVDPLTATLEGANPPTLLLAVEILERLNDPRSVEPLCSLLKDADAAVRLAAVKALGATGSSRALRPLEEARKREWRATGWRERREKCRPYDEAIARIKEALKDRGVITTPIPASSPDPDVSTLPIIGAPPKQEDNLPIPSSKPEEE